MARNVKPGITFYRMDSDHITNKKIRLLFNACDSDGYYIWQCLISYAYDNFGYYFDLNDKDKLELFATEFCKKDLKLISRVIKECIKRDLFNSDLANGYNILTSYMMQDVYFYATAERRKKGSEFSIPEKIWLLKAKDFPLLENPFRGFIFTPDFTGFAANPPGRNPQTKTNTIDLDKKIHGTLSQKDIFLNESSSKNTGGGGQDARRKKNEPIPPNSYQEVEDYFIARKHNPRGSGPWSVISFVKYHAADFWDFYEANGWVQATDQKPIQKWQAAANKWIRNVNPNATAPGGAGTPAPEKVIITNDRVKPGQQMCRDINFMYESFLEDPAKVPVINIDLQMYEYLRQCKAFTFSDQEIVVLHTLTKQLITDTVKMEPTADLIKTYIKKIAVVELFKVYQAAGKPKIFMI